MRAGETPGEVVSAPAARAVKVQSGESVQKGNNRSSRRTQSKSQISDLDPLLTLATHCQIQSHSSSAGGRNSTSTPSYYERDREERIMTTEQKTLYFLIEVFLTLMQVLIHLVFFNFHFGCIDEICTRSFSFKLQPQLIWYSYNTLCILQTDCCICYVPLKPIKTIFFNPPSLQQKKSCQKMKYIHKIYVHFFFCYPSGVLNSEKVNVWLLKTLLLNCKINEMVS